MDPNAEAASSPEFDLVAMAEEQNAAHEDTAQAVMTAEPGAAVSTADIAPAYGLEGKAAAESAGNESVAFDQLDDRRQGVVGGCGAGACGGCVQRCGAYDPDDTGEEFDLFSKATESEESDANDFDFRSRIQFSREEAQKRMAELKAAKTGEAQSNAADRPTPEQRDQIIEIRETAANPERVRGNLALGHARMAERQKEREARMAAEQAKQATAGDIPEPGADRERAATTSVQQARAEYNSRRPAESEVTVKAAEAIQAQITKPQPEETAAAAQRRPSEQVGDKTSWTNEVEARRHADQMAHSQAASAQSSEESGAQSRQVVSGHTKADQSYTIIESAVHAQQRIHHDRMLHREDAASFGSAQTSSIARATQAGGPRQAGARPYNATSSHSKFFRVNKAVPRPKSKADATRAHRPEAKGNEMLTVQTDAHSETSDTEPVFPPAISSAQHEFRLAVPAADAPDRAVSHHKVNMGVSRDPDEGMRANTPLKNRKKQKIRRELPRNNAEEVPGPASAEIEYERRATASSKKDVSIKGSAELERSEIEESDELDQAEANGELTEENFDHIIAYMREPGRKYSVGSGKKENIWEPNPNNRGKKTVQRTSRRIRSSSPATHKSRRNRKKFSKLLASLGQFVTASFSRQQQEINEGVEA